MQQVIQISWKASVHGEYTSMGTLLIHLLQPQAYYDMPDVLHKQGDTPLGSQEIHGTFDVQSYTASGKP